MSKNFKSLVQGLEQFYSQRLDSNISVQHINIDLMIQKKDFAILIDLVELVMGVIVNCEDKEEYIQRIISLDEKT